MSEPIIEVRHLSKSFGTHVVLRDVDFTVNHGDVDSITPAQAPAAAVLARYSWDRSAEKLLQILTA